MRPSTSLHPGALRSTIWRDQPGIGVAENAASSITSRELRAALFARSSKLRSPKPSYSYIERCFRWAHEADPQALLFYNEAEAETMNPKSDAIYAMVRDFRQRGVPIDGVGFQMHIANLHADVASISANIKRFTALGVQVHITEMDVALPVDANGNARPEDLQRQADIYREIATACLVSSRMHGDPDVGFHGQVFLDRIALEAAHKARRCCLIGTIGPSLPTRRCGMRWRSGRR